MRYLKYLPAIILPCLFYSCEKYEGNPNTIATYDRLMSNLDLSCPDAVSDIYMSATMDNTQVCYLDKVEDRNFNFGYFSNFTTPGPGTNVGSEPSVVKKRIRISFRHQEFIEGEDYIELWLQKMPGDTDQITYLKTFFAKSVHNIKDLRDRDQDVLIRLRMLDRVTDTAGRGYNISSEYGDQEGSFLKVNHLNIEEDKEVVRFSFEMEFECNLYHFSQNGREGLWSELTDGKLKAEIVMDKE